MNFYNLLMSQTKIFGEKIFLQIDEKIFTYSNFLSDVDSCKINFDGDEIFISEKNFYNQAVKFFAAQKFNKKPIILHEKMTEDDINFSHGGEKDILGVLTSGTTGKPKILYRTYESWAEFFPEQNKIFKIDSTTKIFIHGSLSFTGNLNVFLSILFAGGTILTSEKFSIKNWQNLIKTATNIYLVPTKLRFLIKGEKIFGVKSIFTGSQILTEKQSLALMKKFPDAEIILYYGASELNYITYKKIDEKNICDVKNLGKTFSGVEIEIRENFIYVKNNFHVSGIKIPYSVGDCGHLDEQGNLIFEGRGEDFINCGGVKINAVNIETKLLKIPEVEAAAVVKISDEIRGENFKIYLVAPKNIRPLVRKILSPVEMPKEIIFVESLPLNDRGKIDKKFLISCGKKHTNELNNRQCK